MVFPDQIFRNQVCRFINVQLLALFFVLTLPNTGFGQDEKAEMIIRNYRSDTISMNFSYVVGDYSWTLMERDIPVDGDLTYRFPTGLPSCEYLIDWEIDDARLLISSVRGEICEQQISLCERERLTIEVRSNVCVRRQSIWDSGG